MLRMELVLFIMHFRIIPEGRFEMENFYLLVILKETVEFYVDLSIFMPYNFYIIVSSFSKSSYFFSPSPSTSFELF